MDSTTAELMLDQVRAIYRALSGNDLPDSPVPKGKAPEATDVVRRFADLEAVARTLPPVVERVPPFSFSPPLDAVDDEREVTIELAIPGIGRDDFTVECNDSWVVITGFRRGGRASNGRSYFHAEIPRGPFHRVIRLPVSVAGEPRVELNGGVIEIRLSKLPAGDTPAKA
jgi:HSP20 family molecular chaperone IbpA